MFEYLPLRVGETTGRLTLQSSDLGAYQYDLHLVATAPQPEKPVHFTTTLGGFQQQQCRFLSYARGRTEYTCKVKPPRLVHIHKSVFPITPKQNYCEIMEHLTLCCVMIINILFDDVIQL